MGGKAGSMCTRVCTWGSRGLATNPTDEHPIQNGPWCLEGSMIEWLLHANGAPGLLQTEQRPMVYLDHWAVLTLSKDPALSRRFAEALATRAGTLALSWVNVAEFAKVGTDEARQAEQFVELNLPRLFFLEVNPFVVLQRERWPGRPYADFGLLGTVAGLVPEGARPFTVRGLFTVMSGRGLETMDRWNRIFVERMGALRAETERDEDFALRVRQALTQRGAGSETFVVMRELIASVMRDTKTPITANDAQDFFHAMVPVLVCDWVLLDGAWENRVRQTQARWEKANVRIQIANVASKRRGGLETFLGELEG
jgi:hypothetical protein